jgi:hypothetical protein
MSNSASQPRRAWISKTYLVLANTLVLCVALEVGWRALAPAVERGTRYVSVRGDDVPYALHPYFQTSFPPDSNTLRGARLAGWPVHPMKDDGARFRVVFLGGSTTATMYPYHVRDELERALGPTTIYVLGYDWHCSLHSLYKLWTYADTIAPDLVVVLDNVNDFYRGFTSPATSLPQYREDYSHHAGALHAFWTVGRSRFDGRPVFHARPNGAFEAFEGHADDLASLGGDLLSASAFLRSVRAGFARPPTTEAIVTAMPDGVVLRALPQFERNMANLARSCRVKDVPVLFLTMPWTLASGRSFLPPGTFFTNDGRHHLDDAGFRMGIERFNDAVLALADEPHAHVFALHERIIDPALFLDEVHLTKEGQKLEGEAVARHVIENELLRTPRER